MSCLICETGQSYELYKHGPPGGAAGVLDQVKKSSSHQQNDLNSWLATCWNFKWYKVNQQEEHVYKAPPGGHS